jgi:glucosamine--fructose-6-phosphate aminotransferase (isomerizing)
LCELIQSNPQIYTVGAGTAGFAAGQLAYLLRSLAGLKAVELKAYEVDSYEKLFNHRSVLIALSQSGETADTLEAIKLAQCKKTRIVSLVNMMGSTMSRESDLPFYLRVGPEICVVSTKAFTGQLAWSYLLAQTLAGDFASAQKILQNTHRKLAGFLKPQLFKQMKKLAHKLAKEEHIFILGRGQNYYIAQEGALKIKETSYKHAEAFSAGELKHGVIALIEKDTPVICIVSEDLEKDTMLNAAHEVKARGGQIIGVAKNNEEVFDEFIKVPNGESLDFLFNVIPFQLLGYYLCLEEGYNPDKPRNLAKSVTVK